MSAQHLSPALRSAVRERARGRCEYCRVHEDDVLLPHEPDHIIAEQHGGKSTVANLALACFHCNRYKGPNISSIDSQTGRIVPLFNPREEFWNDHFQLNGPEIVPLSPTGRVTVFLLKLNSPDRIRVRQTLIDVGRFPSK